MKFKGMLKSVLAISLLTVPLISNAIDTKISGEMWGRWTTNNAKYKIAPNKYETKMDKNYISLERGYLGLETAFTANTKARFTVDMFSSDATHETGTLSDSSQTTFPIEPGTYTSKTSSVDGAGLKLKYGYVEFGNLTPIPDLYLTVGLQKTYFGTIYDWTYGLIEKAPTDLYKVVASSDYGVTLNGFIPAGMGEYAFGVYNGEGYKKVGASLSDNTDFAYLANVRVTPIAGLTLGGSFMSNSVGRDEALVGNVKNAKYEEQSLMDGLVRLAYGPVDCWVEYISKDIKYPNAAANAAVKDYTAKGLMIMPTLNLKPLLDVPFEVIGRYDSWDESDRAITDSGRALLHTTVVGLNYNFLFDASDVPQLTAQLNYESKKYDEKKSNAAFANGMKDNSQVMLQLKWKFANTISN